MANNQGSGASGRLVPEVACYATPRFVLRAELDSLDRVRRVEAAEAVILYCARILEALATDALAGVGLVPSSNLYSNLDLLTQFGLIPTTTRYWAHALRRVGNEVRHVRRGVTSEDADLALVLADRWLGWFFQQFRHGPRLDSLTTDRGPLRLGGCEALWSLIAAIDDAGTDPLGPVRRADGELPPACLRTPALPAVVAEMLLDRDGPDAALGVLRPALARFADDPRLRQLEGLCYSRGGDLTRAHATLEPLYARHGDDDEITGIMAGIYKRMWSADRDRAEWLVKSHRAYLTGWMRSKKSNAYLGINMATTALLLGRHRESRHAAGEIRDLLLSRASRLSRHADDRDLSSNYWDHVSLAEAELLLGLLGVARRSYREAFGRHPERRSSRDVTITQLGSILPALGLSCPAESFAGPPAGEGAGARIVVGVTGHRTLPAGGSLRARVAEVLSRLRRTGSQDGPRRLVALSPLAEGADRLVAGLVLEHAEHGALDVVLPMELADYRTDFRTPESQAEFQSLLDRAELITFPDGPPPPGGRIRAGAAVERPGPAREQGREADYERCGRFVVDHCDVLMAIWDGQPAHGRGGTAEIVAHAREVGRPLVWVHPATPHDVRFERPGPLFSSRVAES